MSFSSMFSTFVVPAAYLIVRAIYFIFPAYVANMLPAIFSKTKFLKALTVPVDRGAKLLGKPLLGKNKTVRGFVVGITGAMLFALLQQQLHAIAFFKSIALLDYGLMPAVQVALLGFLLGAGALLGDAAESCVKRQLGLRPGAAFVPWDQLDYIVGALLLSMLLYTPPLHIIITLLIISPFLHILVNMLGYALKIKDVWW